MDEVVHDDKSIAPNGKISFALMCEKQSGYETICNTGIKWFKIDPIVEVKCPAFVKLLSTLCATLVRLLSTFKG